MAENGATAARRSEVRRLRDLIVANPALSEALAQIWSPEAFARRLAELAREHGIGLGEAEVAWLLSPGAPPVEYDLAAPPPGWLPAEVTADGGAPSMRCVFLGRRRLAEPSYEDSLRAAAGLFNQLLRVRTPLQRGTADAGLTPAGLVFHMSRCGSTLVSQMLAASPANLVVAEAPPIDQVIRLGGGPDHTAERLRAIVAAIGQPRCGEQRLFIKLDSWHIHALPLFRRAFPQTPWAFVYREPTEVLVSHRRQPGLHVTPGLVPPVALGGAEWDGGSLEDHAARVLAAICDRAAAEIAEGGGLLVNYDELPSAVAARVLPHFGVTPSAEELARMNAAATRDAKHPHAAFAADSADKRAAASAAVRAAVDRHLAVPYQRLEALRAARAARADDLRPA